MKKQEKNLPAFESFDGRYSRGGSVYQQTAQAIIDYISENELKSGDRLPTYRRILQELNISDVTAQRALGILQDDGYIERQHGKGIFVADRLATGELAIVIRPQLLEPASSPYYYFMTRGIWEAVHEYNPDCMVKMHFGRKTDTDYEQATSLDILEPRVMKNLRGVFTFHHLYETETQLQKAGIPVVALGKFGSSYSVEFDNHSFYEQAISHLRDVGCKSVGLLSCKLGENPQNSPEALLVSACAKTKGLESRPEWMLSADKVSEKAGYELFKKFLGLSDKPDGIIVTDDVFCCGVLRAILQFGIKVPQQLRLITHANKQMVFPYHMPLTRIENDTTKQAKLAAGMMISLVEGDMPKQKNVSLPMALVKGETT